MKSCILSRHGDWEIIFDYSSIVKYMSKGDINHIKQYIILYHITVSNDYLPRFQNPAPYLQGWVEFRCNKS